MMMINIEKCKESKKRDYYLLRRGCTTKQEGHLIKPLELQEEQILKAPLFSANTLWLPSHLSHTTNLSPPQRSHAMLRDNGSRSISSCSSPLS